MQKGVYVASASIQPPADQKADNKKGTTTEEESKEILVDPTDLDKKPKISSKLDPK
jgi:hypothetical protein